MFTLLKFTLSLSIMFNIIGLLFLKKAFSKIDENENKIKKYERMLFCRISSEEHSKYFKGATL